jgi:hypothetical protein
MSIVLTPVSPAGPSLVFGEADFEKLSGGAGGWETLDRPRRAAAVGWTGTPALTLELPLVLDGMEAGGRGIDRSVEPQRNLLNSWGVANRSTGEPVVLAVRGYRTVSPSARWVVQGIEWGEYITGAGGVIVQAFVTVSLQHYLAPELVRGPAAKARSKQVKKPGKKHGKKTTKKPHKKPAKH